MIEQEFRGNTLWITLTRPEKRNALTKAGWEQLAEALDTASSSANAAVITGTEGSFCAGDDINLFAEAETADDVDELCHHIYNGLQGIESTSIPVIAAVNGVAHGGGCEMVAACDLAVATEAAEFALPETRIGAVPSYMVERVAPTASKKRIMELILTGESINAERAREWGLVNRVVDDQSLDSAVEEYVQAISKSPKRAIALSKRHVTNRLREPGELERQIGNNAYAQIASESNEGVAAFLEKRKPSFDDTTE